MASGVGEPLADIGQQRRIGGAPGRHGIFAQANAAQHQQEGEIADGVDGEGGADIDGDDQQAGQRRADEARQVEDDGVDGDGGGDVPSRHQARHQGEAGRLNEALRGAGDQNQEEKQFRRHPFRDDQADQDDGCRHGNCLRDGDQPQVPAPVGHGTAERAQHKGWRQLRHRQEAEPGAGAGQLPRQPADRHALHPVADQADRISGAVEAVVAMPQGPPDGGELVEFHKRRLTPLGSRACRLHRGPRRSRS